MFLVQMMKGLRESEWRERLLQMEGKTMTPDEIVKVLQKLEAGRQTNQMDKPT